MNDLLKWVLKVSLQAVAWVFILSINVSGRPLFMHAHDTLVDNTLVHTVDEELADLWTKLSKTAQTTFSEQESDDEKAM